MHIKNLLGDAKKTVSECLSTANYCHHLYNCKLSKNNVLLESRNGLDLAGNIFYLLKEITSGDYPVGKIYLSVCDKTRKKAEALVSRYNIKGVTIVRQGSHKYYRLLATVKYIFTDTSLPRAYVKREGQIFTNTWHGTPLKKMGKYNIAEKYSMGNVQRSLLFSDYLIFPNDYMRDKMLKSYNIENLYKGTVLLEGYPRNSVFFDKSGEEGIREKLGFEGKRVYVYMPTWKAENMGKTLEASLNKLRQNLKEIDSHLSSDEIFLLKLHPLVAANADVSGFEHIKAFPSEFESYEVLSACDVLVTDYSSVFFDFASSGKKIVLYTPDESDYETERGFYFPLSELPFPSVKTAEELARELSSPKNYDDSEFVKRFCTYDRKDAPKAILSKILKGEDACKTYEIPKSDKPKVLFYCGALLQNGLTAAFKNILGLIDLNERDYYIAIKQSAFKNHPERLEILPEELSLYSMASNLSCTFLEALAFTLYYRKNKTGKFINHYVNRALERDFKKHFTGFDMDYVINFSGYDKYVIALLQRFNAHRTIFVHSDMQKEISLRSNQHNPTLSAAYKGYDKVAVVTEAMRKPTVKISGREDNIVVVGNSFDADRIKANSKKAIEYDFDTRESIHHPSGIEGILNEDGTKIISIGRFSAEKQHIMLIDAFEEYNRENPESYLIIIGGGGELYAKTVRYANSKPCSKNIAILYSVSNPMPILKRCDLFVLSSQYEALGLVLFEADALGVPSICAKSDGPAEILNRYGGNIVENSKEGLVEGMRAFSRGEVKPMNIDFKKYNEVSVSQFESIFEK